MAIIVEDGTGKSTAESLCSVVYATAYHSARGNTAWALLTNAKMEESLRKATDYFSYTYGQRLSGERTYPTIQSLDEPRVGVVVNGDYVDSNIVPDLIQRVIAELALKAATAELNPDLTQGVISEQVGPIAVTYDKNSPQRVRYTAIDAMLAPYLKNGSGGCMVRLERA